MAKKIGIGNPAFKGTLSTVLGALFVLGLLTLPFYVAVKVDEARTGKGYFTPETNICWDLNSNNDMATGKYFLNSVLLDQEGNTVSGWSADWDGEGMPSTVFWIYGGEPITSHVRHYPSRLGHNLVDIQSNKTVDKYILSTLRIETIEGEPIEHYKGEAPYETKEQIHHYLNISVDEFKNDITKLEYYFDCQTQFTKLDYIVWYISDKGRYKIEDGSFNQGNITSIDIDVFDLINIISLGSEEREYMRIDIIVEEKTDHFNVGEFITFDAQLYCVESKIVSMERIGMWYIGIGSFMLFCWLLMLPTISFKENVYDPISKTFIKLIGGA